MCQGKTFLLSVSLYFSLAFCLMCSRETRERERVRRGNEKKRACVCVREGEIHYSDNESIWESMRQFASPVFVSSIQGEDALPVGSWRTASSEAALLACYMLPAAVFKFKSIQ